MAIKRKGSFAIQLSGASGCRKYVIIIDLEILQAETETASITQEFANQIDAVAFPKEMAPFVNNALGIKRILPHLLQQLQCQQLAFILIGNDPYPELTKFCLQLKPIRIAWVTNEPIKPPLRGGFPPQANLFNLLQQWVNSPDD